MSLTAALADSNITKVILGSDISTPLSINRPVELDLNGNNITNTLTYAFGGNGVSKITGTGTISQVDVTTPLASFEQGANVTISTLNLINVAPATYTNYGTITTANITDTDARFLNQGTASVNTLNVNTTGYVTLGGSSPLENVVVTAAASVNLSQGTTVTNLEVNGSTTVNNGGTISGLTGSGTVTVTNSDNGGVEGITNPNVTVTLPGEADQSLGKVAELVESSGVHSATFTWSSTNGVGTQFVEKPARYSYFNDGAYLDITVKGANDENVAFDTIFEDMTLVTDGGNVDSIKGTGGRQAEDWAGTDGQWKTKLKTDGTKAVFYGVRQTGTGTAVGATRTVGFKAGDSRTIDLALKPKPDLANGTYTVIIQPKQQTGVKSGKNLGNPITYTIIK